MIFTVSDERGAYDRQLSHIRHGVLHVRLKGKREESMGRNWGMKIWLLKGAIALVCVGCTSTYVASEPQPDTYAVPVAGQLSESQPDTNEVSEDGQKEVRETSEAERQKMRETFITALLNLEFARRGLPEYRVLIVNWASPDNDSLDVFAIVNGLTNGGEIWLNKHAADVIDENWKRFGNANYEGSFRVIPALINWVGTYGWRLMEVHDSQLSTVNYPEKLYFIKTILTEGKSTKNK